MMIRFFAAILVAAFGASTAAAQMAGGAKGGAGAFAGITKVDVAQLNRALEARGLPTFAETASTYGLGGHVRLGRFLVGGSGQRLRAAADDGDAFRGRLAGGHGMLDVGYAIHESVGWTFAPLAGVGIGRVDLKIDPRDPGRFEDVLDNPRQGTRLDATSAFVHGGLDVQRRVRVGEGTFSLSLRVGGQTDLGGTSWRTGAADLDGGPAAGFAGAYVRLGVSRSIGRRRDALLPAFAPVLMWLPR